MSTDPRQSDDGEPGAIRHEVGGPHEALAVRTRDGGWVQLHSRRDPAAESDRLVAPLFDSDRAPSVVFVIGPGLGYVVEAIARRAPAMRVIALEPLAGAAQAMRDRRARGGLAEPAGVLVLQGPEYRGSADAWRMVGHDTAPPILVHPVLRRHFPAEVARAELVARRIIEGAAANEEARRRFAGPYLLNTLGNLPALWREGDAAELFGGFAGLPVVVVGAGPSLDAAIEPLRHAKDRAVIVAVDTALRPLLAAGIEPHLVVAVDPQEANARHLRGVTGTERVWLVTEASLPASVFEPFQGRAFLFQVSDHHPWPWLRAHGADRGKLRAWGSVLTSAFDLALRIGGDPIAFVGADLSYPAGQMYCRNTIYEREWATYETVEARQEAIARRLASLVTTTEPDVSGAPALSTPHFLQFRDWIASAAAEASPVRVFNATGAGILRGAAIQQCAPADLHRLVGRPIDVRLRIARAWTTSHDRASVVPGSIARALADGWQDAVPVASWIDFSAGVVSDDAIRRRLASAVLTRLAETVDAEHWDAASHALAGSAEGLYWLGATGVFEPTRVEAGRADGPESWHEASALAAEVASGWWTRTPLAADGVLQPSMPHATRQLRTLLGAAIRVGREPASGDGSERTIAIRVAHRGDARAEVVALPGFRVPAVRLLRYATGTIVRRGVVPIDAAVSTATVDALFPPSVEIGSARGEGARSATLSIAIAGVDDPGEVVGYVAPVEPFGHGGVGHPVTLGERSAAVTRIGDACTWVVDADGRTAEGPTWPGPVRGHLPWGRRGGSVAWSDASAGAPGGQDACAWWREHADADPRSTVLPFRPGPGVVLDDGRVACACVDGGLATFGPDGDARRVAADDLFCGPIRIGADVSSSVLTRGAGRPRAVAAPHAVLWDTRGAVVSAGPLLSTAGPVSSRAARGAWTADAHPMAGVVRLARVDGVALDLTCHEPGWVAWAGEALVVGLLGWNVLLFPDLARRLDALAGSAGRT